MKYYDIEKCEYEKGVIANYGGGYTEDDLKKIMKGYKKEVIEFDDNACFYTRKGSKYYYMVTSYEREVI